jgi:hypothetical protein
MKLTFYLVNVCDPVIAKLRNPNPQQILKNVEDLENHQLQPYFDIMLKKEGIISCETTGCLLKDTTLHMCYKFDKNEQKVCVLPEQEEGDAIMFNNANFALITVVNYMNRFFKTRRIRSRLQNTDQRYLTNIDSFFLGEQFSFPGGDSGIPVYTSDGSIELAYKYGATIDNITAIATIVAQQMQQQVVPGNNRPNNGEEMEEEPE